MESVCLLCTVFAVDVHALKLLPSQPVSETVMMLLGIVESFPKQKIIFVTLVTLCKSTEGAMWSLLTYISLDTYDTAKIIPIVPLRPV